MTVCRCCEECCGEPCEGSIDGECEMLCHCKGRDDDLDGPDDPDSDYPADKDLP